MRDFSIDIYRLKLGEHHFEFRIDDAFLARFDHSEIDKGELNAEVSLIKKERLLECSFNIQGDLVLVCDRSLDSYEYPVSLNKMIIFKYGEEAKELSDEMILIPRNQQVLDLSQYVYEFVALSVPMKKLHPRFDGEPVEDALVYSSSNKLESTEAKAADPRWEALKKLKKN